MRKILMRAALKNFFTVLLGAGLLAFAGGATAACTTGCAPPAPPTVPNNPRPPHTPCTSCGGGANVNVNVNVKVGAGASAGASAGGTYYGGGYSNWSQTPGYPQAAGSLNVVSGNCCGAMESYSEQQTFTKQTIIQASCIDDTGVPHPASQVFSGRDIDGSYRGEVYRCIAGTHMQWTYSDYDGSHINFDGGKNATCAKNEALWFENGTLTCKTQIPQRQCNERSLLRRFGVGVKILTLTRTETITKQRQVACNSCNGNGTTVMSFDGGVGGFVQ
jgi:hypothetical protein